MTPKHEHPDAATQGQTARRANAHGAITRGTFTTLRTVARIG